MIILLFGVLFCSQLSAQSVDTLWQKANTAYAAGMFKDASDGYLKIINEGKVSADLYYNLANAYYKQNMLGNSILYYERALKLSPSNEDIIHNLELARTQVLDKIEPVPTFFMVSFFRSLSNAFSTDGWAILAITLFVLALALILIAYFFTGRLAFRRISFWSGIVLILLCIGCNFIAGHIEKQHDAIILSPVSTIKSSPDASGKEIFILHEGAKVRVLDELSGWKKIKVENGNQGWIPSEDIEQV